MKRWKTMALALAAVLAFSLAYGWRQSSRAEEYLRQVNAGYRKSLYEMAELAESMRVHLAKLQVTRSESNRRKLLAELALYAQSAQADMADLPENLSFSEGAVKFFNQVADFSVSYLDNADRAEDTLGQLLSTCEQVSGELSKARERLEAGETLFDEVPGGKDVQATALTLNYPSLLYDGPFSDGRALGKMALSGQDLTAEEAQKRAASFVGESRIKGIRFVRESRLQTPCYEYDIDTEDGVLSLALTRQGGHALYMLTDRQPEQRKYSVGECVDFASRFLSQRGYGDMRVSYWQLNGAMITVNFAAAQDNVILYPDLVKVDVSMETGGIVGIEAGNYLSSHRLRKLNEPAITAGKAKELVDSRLATGTTRLCVIPLEDGKEAFCYEISASEGYERYLIYIDAMTGEEREILKIVEDENGQLAV